MIYLENFSKRSLQEVMKTYWRRLEDVLKTLLQKILKTSWIRFEDVLTRGLEDISKTSWHVLKTYDQDNYVSLDQDVLKTSWRRLLTTKKKDLFKASSRHVNQAEGLLGCMFSYVIFVSLFCCFYSYVICILLLCTRMSSVCYLFCTHMSFICYSSVFLPWTKIKSFYQSSSKNENNFTDIMMVSPNILAKN